MRRARGYAGSNFHGGWLLRRRCRAAARDALFEALLKVSEWTPIYFLWRPNLPDEGDNHVLELAVAGGARAIITGNIRDFARGEIAFPGVKVCTTGAYLNWRRTP